VACTLQALKHLWFLFPVNFYIRAEIQLLHTPTVLYLKFWNEIGNLERKSRDVACYLFRYLKHQRRGVYSIQALKHLWFLFPVNFYIRAEIQLLHTPTVLHLKFWNDPLGQINVSLPRGIATTFHLIIFKKIKTTIWVHQRRKQTERQTDRQTEGRTTYHRIIALGTLKKQ